MLPSFKNEYPTSSRNDQSISSSILMDSIFSGVHLKKGSRVVPLGRGRGSNDTHVNKHEKEQKCHKEQDILQVSPAGHDHAKMCVVELTFKLYCRVKLLH